MVLGAVLTKTVGTGPLSVILPEFEAGHITAAELRAALRVGRSGPADTTMPFLQASLAAHRSRAGLPARATPDDLQAPALAAFNAERGGPPQLTVCRATAFSATPTSGRVHVPALAAVNAQALPAPGADLLADSSGHPTLLGLVLVGLNAGDGWVRADASATGLGTALFEGHLHLLYGIMCAGASSQAWMCACARLNWNGSGVTAACPGTTRSVTYQLSSTFGAAPARRLADLVGAGKHITAFGPAHVQALL
jgi:hypothetical protein